MSEKKFSFGKQPLSQHQFIWIKSRKTGVCRTIIGPDPLELTDDELVVCADPEYPGLLKVLGAAAEVLGGDQAELAIQEFVTVGPGEYVIIHNPSEAAAPERPNGVANKGANEVKDLRFGDKRVVTKGHFPLWPNQWIERWEAHHLGSNEYLVVEVESDNVDHEAPYYDVTVACSMEKAGVVEVIQTSTSVQTKQFVDDSQLVIPISSDQPVANESVAVVDKHELETEPLSVGRRIVIRGNVTPIYIPPSGIKVLDSDDPVKTAVVLGPSEFCVLLNQEGQPEVHIGPGRVFPGPWHVFQIEGSRNRVYDAYHLRQDLGLLIRVTAQSIDKEDLVKSLPVGAENLLTKEVFYQGDEVFLRGLDAYVVPSASFEVVHPETREVHIGNNHDLAKVFVEAIGVDQKSGVYVQNVQTGNIKLVKGETVLLLDPRKECHVKRRIPIYLWNLMVAANEPHKQKAIRDSDAVVETPWALSVNIPKNTVVLVVSKNSQRAVVGPCTELLEYDETLEVMTLSKGTPKSNNDGHIQTCFLRVAGNHITDKVEVRTSDNQDVVIKVHYDVEFIGEGADQLNWFREKDYVIFLCREGRSRLAAAARQKTLQELYLRAAEFVRDTLLGAKQSPGQSVPTDEPNTLSVRPGWQLANNMKVLDVQLGGVTIKDPKVEQSLNEAAQKMVTADIQTQAAQAELNAAILQAEIAQERAKLRSDELERKYQLSLLELEKTIGLDEAREGAKHALAKLEQDHNQARALDRQKHEDILGVANRESDRLDAELDLSVKDARRKSVAQFREALVVLQKDLLAAAAAADEVRFKAVQSKLIAAIEGLGDKQVLASLAEHLPAASGSMQMVLGGVAGLRSMVEGTPIARAFNFLKHDFIGNGDGVSGLTETSDQTDDASNRLLGVETTDREVCSES